MLSFELIDVDKAIDRYEHVWENLVIENNCNPSLLPGWLLVAAKSFGKTITVYIQKEADEVIGIIPFYIEVRPFLAFRIRHACIATNLVSYHPELLIKKGKEDVVLERFFEYAYKDKIDCVAAIHFLTTSPSFKAMSRFAERNNLLVEKYPGDSSPYLPLEDSWQNLLLSKGKKFRYKVRTRQKQIDAADNYEIKWIDDVPTLLDIIFEIEKNSWKVSAQMDITSSQVEQNYYRDLVPFMKKKKILNANVLFIDGSPVAYNLCYLWNNTIGQIKTSYDEQFKTLTPGAMVVEAALREYVNQGYSEFDFLGDVMQHKLSWTKKTREHESLYVFRRSFKTNLMFYLKKLKQTIIRKTGQG